MLSSVTCLYRNAAEARVAAIGVELQERESSLTRQLQSHQASSCDQISHLTSENSHLRHDLDTAMAQVRKGLATLAFACCCLSSQRSHCFSCHALDTWYSMTAARVGMCIALLTCLWQFTLPMTQV